MADVNVLVHSFNNGEASRAALNRVDQERLRLFAERQENLFPYTIGKAIMRPGTKHLGSTLLAGAKLIPFKRSITERALLELAYNDAGNGVMRVWLDDALVTRPSVTSTITNGDFALAGGGWTLTSTGGATATMSDGLTLEASGQGGEAIAKQQVSTSDSGTEHAVRVLVTHGPVTFRIGSTDGDDDLVSVTTLDTGLHSLAFTPGSSYWIRFSSKKRYQAVVDSISVESAGVMEIDGYWTSTNYRKIRYDQSLDVLFCTVDEGSTPFKIERRQAGRSWSVVKYEVSDGPFTLARTQDITLTPSVTQGTGTLTASAAFFDSNHNGALFQLTHDNTAATYKLSAAGEHTLAVRVIGINTASYNDRNFSVVVSGTWVGTLQIQRSFDSAYTGFEDFGSAITTNGTTATGDDDDNAIIWYRVIMTAYTSGIAEVQINYDQDGRTGICKVTHVTNSTTATIRVLSDFSDVTASDDWLEGEWSAKQGFPTAVALFDGRLFFGRGDRFWGSVSDAYYSFSLTVEGDAASIQRNVATGGDFSDINWMLPLQRLLFGTSGAEVSARSSSFDEPLTAGSITLKPASTQGSANLSPVKVDSRGLFIHRSKRALYELVYDIEASDYVSRSLMEFNDEVTLSGYPEGGYTGQFVDMAVQRQPETYIWLVRDDGVCYAVFYEPPTPRTSSDIQCWFRVVMGEGNTMTNEPNDLITSVAVLPDEDEDEVYFLVRRGIIDIAEGGTDYAYTIEKLGKHSEAKTRGSTNGTVYVRNGLYMADSYYTATGDGTASQVISGGDHIVGRDVIVIGQKVGGGYGPLLDSNGDVETFTIDNSGQITLSARMTGEICIGLPYYGRWKSSKLAYGAQEGSALLQQKKVEGFGLALIDTNYDGIRIGRNLTLSEMDELPRIKGDGTIFDPTDDFDSTVDDAVFPFPGEWDTDCRSCVLVRPGHTATLSAIIMSVLTNEK